RRGDHRAVSAAETDPIAAVSAAETGVGGRSVTERGRDRDPAAEEGARRVVDGTDLQGRSHPAGAVLHPPPPTRPPPPPPPPPPPADQPDDDELADDRLDQPRAGEHDHDRRRDREQR